ncbi:hypothetical protein BFJ63_vAg4027 [Fusarium oxysporum f. sp. narcissi]|uniref:Uncharacterized protein n=1 Tax=Fusarium oxysporum f. sp. narcissi TaxID=451672 RepID=A0A4Q2W137_FUSOX|nr:hypothetical protein BFJ63_vAg4027 [Fusarium oxysporum f. sp. narcissi]
MLMLAPQAPEPPLLHSPTEAMRSHFVPGYHPKLGKATHTCALRFSFDISIHSLLQPITIILHLQPHQTLRFRFGRKSFKFDRHIY